MFVKVEEISFKIHTCQKSDSLQAPTRTLTFEQIATVTAERVEVIQSTRVKNISHRRSLHVSAVTGTYYCIGLEI